ncbi:hypothetical protein SSS_02172 [Sarcoptes scabiei]|nr:hypothetical protein SSS_02172 [Sarcoptes scabiei]
MSVISIDNYWNRFPPNTPTFILHPPFYTHHCNGFFLLYFFGYFSNILDFNLLSIFIITTTIIIIIIFEKGAKIILLSFIHLLSSISFLFELKFLRLLLLLLRILFVIYETNLILYFISNRKHDFH